MLQADPVDGPAQDLGEQRDGFASLARDELDAGVRAVLVVPPLPDDQARQVVDAVRQGIAEHRRALAPSALVALVARLSRTLAPRGRPAVEFMLWFARRPGQDGGG